MYCASRLEPSVCKVPNHMAALAAFIARKAESDAILTRLAALSAEHFNCASDEITWADVGTLGSYLQRLREVSDAAFHEGEHATRRIAPCLPRPALLAGLGLVAGPTTGLAF